ncbi:MAG TPA: hypothetical protein DCS13_07360, partial [Candidatus Margulisbacteria bacterium]|nr:hypothetical protein [Candidatus Margulisiibacteriota bacterium]
MSNNVEKTSSGNSSSTVFSGINKLAESVKNGITDFVKKKIYTNTNTKYVTNIPSTNNNKIVPSFALNPAKPAMEPKVADIAKVNIFVDKKTILDKLPEIKDTLSNYFENPNEDKLVFKSDLAAVAEAIKNSNLTDDQKKVFQEILSARLQDESTKLHNESTRLQDDSTLNTPNLTFDPYQKGAITSQNQAYLLKLVAEKIGIESNDDNKKALIKHYDSLLLGYVYLMGKNGINGGNAAGTSYINSDYDIHSPSQELRNPSSGADLMFVEALLKRLQMDYNGTPAEVYSFYDQVRQYLPGYISKSTEFKSLGNGTMQDAVKNLTKYFLAQVKLGTLHSFGGKNIITTSVITPSNSIATQDYCGRMTIYPDISFTSLLMMSKAMGNDKDILKARKDMFDIIYSAYKENGFIPDMFEVKISDKGKIEIGEEKDLKNREYKETEYGLKTYAAIAESILRDDESKLEKDQQTRVKMIEMLEAVYKKKIAPDPASGEFDPNKFNANVDKSLSISTARLICKALKKDDLKISSQNESQSTQNEFTYDMYTQIAFNNNNNATVEKIDDMPEINLDHYSMLVLGGDDSAALYKEIKNMLSRKNLEDTDKLYELVLKYADKFTDSKPGFTANMLGMQGAFSYFNALRAGDIQKLAQSFGVSTVPKCNDTMLSQTKSKYSGVIHGKEVKYGGVTPLLHNPGEVFSFPSIPVIPTMGNADLVTASNQQFFSAFKSSSDIEDLRKKINTENGPAYFRAYFNEQVLTETKNGRNDAKALAQKCINYLALASYGVIDTNYQTAGNIADVIGLLEGALSDMHTYNESPVIFRYLLNQTDIYGKKQTDNIYLQLALSRAIRKTSFEGQKKDVLTAYKPLVEAKELLFNMTDDRDPYKATVTKEDNNSSLINVDGVRDWVRNNLIDGIHDGIGSIPVIGSFLGWDKNNDDEQGNVILNNFEQQKLAVENNADLIHAQNPVIKSYELFMDELVSYYNDLGLNNMALYSLNIAMNIQNKYEGVDMDLLNQERFNLSKWMQSGTDTVAENQKYVTLNNFSKIEAAITSGHSWKDSNGNNHDLFDKSYMPNLEAMRADTLAKIANTPAQKTALGVVANSVKLEGENINLNGITAKQVENYTNGQASIKSGEDSLNKMFANVKKYQIYDEDIAGYCQDQAIAPKIKDLMKENKANEELSKIFNGKTGDVQDTEARIAAMCLLYEKEDYIAVQKGIENILGEGDLWILNTDWQDKNKALMTEMKKFKRMEPSVTTNRNYRKEMVDTMHSLIQNYSQQADLLYKIASQISSQTTDEEAQKAAAIKQANEYVAKSNDIVAKIFSSIEKDSNVLQKVGLVNNSDFQTDYYTLKQDEKNNNQLSPFDGTSSSVSKRIAWMLDNHVFNEEKVKDQADAMRADIYKTMCLGYEARLTQFMTKETKDLGVINKIIEGMSSVVDDMFRGTANYEMMYGQWNTLLSKAYIEKAKLQMSDAGKLKEADGTARKALLISYMMAGQKVSFDKDKIKVTLADGNEKIFDGFTEKERIYFEKVNKEALDKDDIKNGRITLTQYLNDSVVNKNAANATVSYIRDSLLGMGIEESPLDRLIYKDTYMILKSFLDNKYNYKDMAALLATDNVDYSDPDASIGLLEDFLKQEHDKSTDKLDTESFVWARMSLVPLKIEQIVNRQRNIRMQLSNDKQAAATGNNFKEMAALFDDLYGQNEKILTILAEKNATGGIKDKDSKILFAIYCQSYIKNTQKILSFYQSFVKDSSLDQQTRNDALKTLKKYYLQATDIAGLIKQKDSYSPQLSQDPLVAMVKENKGLFNDPELLRELGRFFTDNLSRDINNLMLYTNMVIKNDEKLTYNPKVDAFDTILSRYGKQYSAETGMLVTNPSYDSKVSARNQAMMMLVAAEMKQTAAEMKQTDAEMKQTDAFDKLLKGYEHVSGYGKFPAPYMDKYGNPIAMDFYGNKVDAAAAAVVAAVAADAAAADADADTADGAKAAAADAAKAAAAKAADDAADVDSLFLFAAAFAKQGKDENFRNVVEELKKQLQSGKDVSVDVLSPRVLDAIATKDRDIATKDRDNAGFWDKLKQQSMATVQESYKKNHILTDSVKVTYAAGVLSCTVPDKALQGYATYQYLSDLSNNLDDSKVIDFLTVVVSDELKKDVLIIDSKDQNGSKYTVNFNGDVKLERYGFLSRVPYDVLESVSNKLEKSGSFKQEKPGSFVPNQALISKINASSGMHDVYAQDMINLGAKETVSSTVTINELPVEQRSTGQSPSEYNNNLYLDIKRYIELAKDNSQYEVISLNQAEKYLTDINSKDSSKAREGARALADMLINMKYSSLNALQNDEDLYISDAGLTELYSIMGQTIKNQSSSQYYNQDLLRVVQLQQCFGQKLEMSDDKKSIFHQLLYVRVDKKGYTDPSLQNIFSSLPEKVSADVKTEINNKWNSYIKDPQNAVVIDRFLMGKYRPLLTDQPPTKQQDITEALLPLILIDESAKTYNGAVMSIEKYQEFNNQLASGHTFDASTAAVIKSYVESSMLSAYMKTNQVDKASESDSSNLESYTKTDQVDKASELAKSILESYTKTNGYYLEPFKNALMSLVYANMRNGNPELGQELAKLIKDKSTGAEAYEEKISIGKNGQDDVFVPGQVIADIVNGMNEIERKSFISLCSTATGAASSKEDQKSRLELSNQVIDDEYYKKAFEDVKGTIGAVNIIDDPVLYRYLDAKLQTITIPAYYNVLNNGAQKPEDLKGISDLIDALDTTYSGEDEFFKFAKNNPQLIKNILGCSNEMEYSLYKMQAANSFEESLLALASDYKDQGNYVLAYMLTDVVEGEIVINDAGNLETSGTAKGTNAEDHLNAFNSLAATDKNSILEQCKIAAKMRSNNINILKIKISEHQKDSSKLDAEIIAKQKDIEEKKNMIEELEKKIKTNGVWESIIRTPVIGDFLQWFPGKDEKDYDKEEETWKSELSNSSKELKTAENKLETLQTKKKALEKDITEQETELKREENLQTATTQNDLLILTKAEAYYTEGTIDQKRAGHEQDADKRTDLLNAAIGNYSKVGEYVQSSIEHEAALLETNFWAGMGIVGCTIKKSEKGEDENRNVIYDDALLSEAQAKLGDVKEFVNKLVKENYAKFSDKEKISTFLSEIIVKDAEITLLKGDCAKAREMLEPELKNKNSSAYLLLARICMKEADVLSEKLKNTTDEAEKKSLQAEREQKYNEAIAGINDQEGSEFNGMLDKLNASDPKKSLTNKIVQKFQLGVLYKLKGDYNTAREKLIAAKTLFTAQRAAHYLYDTDMLRNIEWELADIDKMDDGSANTGKYAAILDAFNTADTPEKVLECLGEYADIMKISGIYNNLSPDDKLMVAKGLLSVRKDQQNGKFESFYSIGGIATDVITALPAINAINNAKSKEEVKAALDESSGILKIDGNYGKLTDDADKLIIAEAVLMARKDKNGIDKPFDTPYMIAAIVNDNINGLSIINAINLPGATSATILKALQDNSQVLVVVDPATKEKKNVWPNDLETQQLISDGIFKTIKNKEGNNNYRTIYDVSAAVESFGAGAAIVKPINEATTKEQIKTLLDNNISALDISGTYGTLTSDSDKLLIAEAVLKAKNNTPLTTTYDVKAAVDQACSGLPLIKDFNAATTKEQIKTLLDSNLSVLDISGTYGTLTSDSDKLLVAEAVLKAKNNASLTTTYDVKASVDQCFANLTLIKSFNAATTKEEIKVLLDSNIAALNISETYGNLTGDADKMLVAEAVLKSKNYAPVTTTYDVKAAVDQCFANLTLIKSFNEATTKEQIKDLLDNNIAALDISGTYGILTTDSDKLLVAEAVLKAKNNTSFVTTYDVKAAVDQACTNLNAVISSGGASTNGQNQTLIKNLNAATTKEEIKTLLDSNIAALDINGTYGTLTSDADKLMIAEAVLRAKNYSPFTTTYNVKAAVDQSFANLTLIKSFNSATTKEQIKTLLDSNIAALDITGTYGTLTSDSDKLLVAEAVLKSKNYSSFITTYDVKAAVDQSYTNLALIKNLNAATTKEQIKTLLDSNIAALDISGTYGTLTSDADKLLVADAVLKAKNNTPFTTTYDVKAAVDQACSGLTLIKSFNEATTKEEIKTLLDSNIAALDISGTYGTLTTDADKLLVADAVLKAKNNTPFTTTYDVKAAVDQSFASLFLIKSFNEATTKEQIKTLLDSNIAALDISGTYGTLTSDADKLLVADAVLKAKNSTPFTTTYDVKAAVDQSFAGLTLIKSFNEATTKEQIKTLLDSNIAALDISGTYGTLTTDADKLLIADAVLKAKNNTPFTTTYDVKAAVDQSFASLTLIKSFNEATTKEEIKTLLDSNIAALDISGTYGTLTSDADKLLVADAVLKAKNNTPFTTTYDVKAAVDQSFASLTLIKSFNEATTKEQIKTLLDSNIAALDISGTYGTLTTDADKLLIADAVLKAKNNTPFTTTYDVKAAVDQSFASLTLIKSFNEASTKEEIKTLLDSNIAALDISGTYGTLTSDADKLLVADAVLKAKNNTPFTTTYDVKAAVDQACSGLTLIKSFNEATTKEQIKTLLDSNIAALDISGTYGTLTSDADKLLVADAVLKAKNSTPFTTTYDVKAAVDQACSGLTLIKSFNEATTKEQIKTLLDSNIAALDISGTYGTLTTDADKLLVADAVLKAKNNTPFTT